ncbi:MAG: hypothetical protein WC530_07945 [Candidatus Omnitrophota bacterium]
MHKTHITEAIIYSIPSVHPKTGEKCSLKFMGSFSPLGISRLVVVRSSDDATIAEYSGDRMYKILERVISRDVEPWDKTLLEG